jgi:PemK-like, MazF-like toxin of type II toxin-antitoxin system
MPIFSRNEVILVQYPYTDLSGQKVRPAVVVHAPHSSPDLIIVPLTSRVSPLYVGEFVLSDWAGAGLHVPTVVKRGIATIHPKLVVKSLRPLTTQDSQQLDQSLRLWLNL